MMPWASTTTGRGAVAGHVWWSWAHLADELGTHVLKVLELDIRWRPSRRRCGDRGEPEFLISEHHILRPLGRTLFTASGRFVHMALMDLRVVAVANLFGHGRWFDQDAQMSS